MEVYSEFTNKLGTNNHKLINTRTWVNEENNTDKPLKQRSTIIE